MKCQLCGSSRHSRAQCNLSPLADIMDQEPESEERAQKLGAVFDKMHPGVLKPEPDKQEIDSDAT